MTPLLVLEYHSSLGTILQHTTGCGSTTLAWRWSRPHNIGYDTIIMSSTHHDSSKWGYNITIIVKSLASSSVLSGILGATASCLGKCALDPDSLVVAWAQHGRVLLQPIPPHWIEYTTRGLLFLAMLACNALMLGTFVRGLEEQGSITGSALSTAANFCTSALLGSIVWKETFTSLWFMGLGMIFVGMVLLTTTTTTAAEGVAPPDPSPQQTPIADKQKIQ